jgi:hypothetical protein
MCQMGKRLARVDGVSTRYKQSMCQALDTSLGHMSNGPHDCWIYSSERASSGKSSPWEANARCVRFACADVDSWLARCQPSSVLARGVVLLAEIPFSAMVGPFRWGQPTGPADHLRRCPAVAGPDVSVKELIRWAQVAHRRKSMSGGRGHPALVSGDRSCTQDLPRPS